MTMAYDPCASPGARLVLGSCSLALPFVNLDLLLCLWSFESWFVFLRWNIEVAN